MPAKKSSSVKSKGQSGKQQVTFIDILQKDHEKVRDLFEQIEEEEGENSQEIFAQLESELEAHMELEEQFFYPVLEELEDAREKALEAYEEHHVAKTVLAECSGMDVDDERWHAKVSVLQEVVSHHLEEEEKNIFKMAKKLFKKEQVQEITQQIQQKKSGILKKAA